MSVRDIYLELAAEMRLLLALTPPADAPLTQQADHECRKAEFYDRLALAHPTWTQVCREAAGIARMKARQLVKLRKRGF